MSITKKLKKDKFTSLIGLYTTDMKSDDKDGETFIVTTMHAAIRYIKIEGRTEMSDFKYYTDKNKKKLKM